MATQTYPLLCLENPLLGTNLQSTNLVKLTNGYVKTFKVLVIMR